MSYQRKVCHICTATAPPHSPLCSACSSGLALDDSPLVMERRLSATAPPPGHIPMVRAIVQMQDPVPSQVDLPRGPPAGSTAVPKISPQSSADTPATPAPQYPSVATDTPDKTRANDLEAILALARAKRQWICLDCHGLQDSGGMSCSACGGALAAPTAASAVETKPTPRPVAPAADDLSTSSFRLATTSIEGHVRMVCETCFSTSATGSAFCLDCGTAFPTKLPGSKTNSARLATKVAVASDADVPTLHCAAGNNFDATPSGESGFTQPGNNVEPKCTEDSRHVDADGETIPTDKAPPVHDASAPTKSVLHSEAIVFGATITLHGCIPSPQQVTNESGSAPPTTPETTMSLPVDFRPLQDVGLGKSKELVLALSHDSDHSSVARFVILPPPGDKTVRIGKTSVHFLQKVVLAILPTDGTSDEPTHSWNNKLSRGLNDFIGSRPRFQTDKSGPTKGELHVKFVLANAPQSTQKLTTGMTNVTIRIADSNRLRTTYSGQDIGYCPAAEANAQALCCGHEKTVFEFAKKVHPMPITFRVDRVVSTVSNQATVAVASDVAVEGAAATIRTIPGTVPDVAMACGHDVCEVGMSTAQASPPLTCPDVLKSVVVD